MTKRLHRDYTEDRITNGVLVSTLVARYDDDRLREGVSRSEPHTVPECPFGSIGTSIVVKVDHPNTS